MCPGIITIIWSLITSDTGGEEEDSDDSDPDDQLTELLNNQVTRDAMLDLMRRDKKEGGFTSTSKSLKLKQEHYDLFQNSTMFQ